MLRKACSKAHLLSSTLPARHHLNIHKADLGQLIGTGCRGTSACLTAGSIRSGTLACKLSTNAAGSQGTSLDDMDATLTDIRERLASCESARQEHLSLQRDMADDLEALLEDFNGMKDRLDIMASLIMAQTKLFLAAQGGSNSTGSSAESEQPLQPQGAGDVSQPEGYPLKSSQKGDGLGATDHPD